MEEFTIAIRETLIKTVTVEAETYDEALEKVENMYWNEEIILTSEDHVDTEFDYL